MNSYPTRRDSPDRGFTLIELMACVLIVGVLAGLQLQIWRILKERAYSGSEISAVHNVQVALEAAAPTSQGWYWGMSTNPGGVTSWDGREFLPGYVNPRNFYVSVSYSADCHNGTLGPWCFVASVWTQHCSSDSMTWWMKWADGMELSGEMNGAWGC